MRKLLLLFLLLPTSAFADEGGPCWASVMIHSYHANREAHLNERNYGVGLECSFKPQWRAVAGEFKNSVFRRSIYAGALYDPWEGSALRLAVVGGVINGYPLANNGGFIPMVAPVLIWEPSRYVGINLIALPKIGDISAVIAIHIQIKGAVSW